MCQTWLRRRGGGRDGDSTDTFCSGCEKGGGLLASLVLGMNKHNVRKSDETQNVAHVGFLKIKSFHRSALFICATAGSDDDNFLFFEKALPAVWPVAAGLPDPHYLIDPRLEQRRDREVVHRRANHDRICRLEFFDQFVRGGQIRSLRRRQLRFFELGRAPVIGNQWKGCCRKVPLDDFAIRMVRAPFFGEFGGQPPGYGTGPCTGINLKQFHLNLRVQEIHLTYRNRCPCIWTRTVL